MTNDSPEARLADLNIELPAVHPPAGTFVHAVRAGPLLFVGGHLPWRADGTPVQGKLGAELDVEAGHEAARLAALSALATIRAELGSLDKVQRVARLNGVVNSTPDFMQHTQVINGASDLFVAVFGDRGQHARLAVGVSSLPFNLALEIELVVEIAAG